jgi:hypothetical protein
MPHLDAEVVNATLSDTVLTMGEKYAQLERNSQYDRWAQTDPYKSSGTITFENFSGWALRLPPYTFEPDIQFQNTDTRDNNAFGRWGAWADVVGSIAITHSNEFLGMYGEEVRIDRDTGVATTTVRRTMSHSLRADDVMEFKVYLPADASALSVTLHSGAGSATYTEATVLTDDWNIVVIEIDQPTSTSAPWDLAAVDAISISVTFTGVVAARFIIASSLLDRTAQTGGEVRWQVSLDSGVTWLGWDGTAWAAGSWTHPHWVERNLSTLVPATSMQWQVRCRITPSENMMRTPRVRRIVCGIDFDLQFHAEEDLKRSVIRAIELSTVRLRGLATGDGTVNVTLKSHFTSSTVSAVYLGDFDSMDTTTDLFTSQAAETEIHGGYDVVLTLNTVVASGSAVVIHYTANPSVKISADPNIIEASIPEINIVFPTHNIDERMGVGLERYSNRSLGYAWMGLGSNYESYEWEIYCVGHNSMMMSAMDEAIQRVLDAGITSDATGFTIRAGDILPSDVESERGAGLHVRRIAVESIIARWQDLTLTQVRQVRALLPGIGILPARGYRVPSN